MPAHDVAAAEDGVSWHHTFGQAAAEVEGAATCYEGRDAARLMRLAERLRGAARADDEA